MKTASYLLNIRTALLLVIVLLCTGTSALAADFYWDGSTTGYLDEGIYTTAGAPVTGDNVYLYYTGAATPSLFFRYDSPYFSSTIPHFNHLYINSTGTGFLTLDSSSTYSGGTLSAAYEYIGNSDRGDFEQSSGSHLIENSLYMGYGPDSHGTYNMTSGSLGATDTGFNLYCGLYGTGEFSQSGGTVDTGAGTYTIGYYSGSEGFHSLSGTGVFTSSTSFYIGRSGTGTFDQSGGEVLLQTRLDIGSSSDGEGTYNLTDGTVTATDSAFDLSVGRYGTGTLTQSGGTIDMGYGYLYVGEYTGGTGTYELSDSGLLNYNTAFIGHNGTGIFEQTGGTHQVINSLYVGYNTGSTGTYTMSGGTLEGNFYLNVGMHGTGTFEQTGGTVNIGNAGPLRLGYYEDGEGTYLLSGSSSYLHTGNTYVGYYGTGTFTQTGGNHSVEMDSNYDRKLVIAYGQGSSGTYNLDGGSLTADVENNDVFNMDGGTYSSTGTFENNDLFRYYSGTFYGSLINNGTVYLYDDMTVSSGITNNTSFSVSGMRTVSVSNGNFDNNGTLNLSNGSLSTYYSSTSVNNYGELSASNGSIAGYGHFNNYGRVSLEYGALSLENTNDSINYGTFDLNSGYQLRLNGSDLDNYGIVNLNNGLIIGASEMINYAGGTVSGPGTILSGFSNTGGRIVVTPGNTLIDSAFSNSGQILLTDALSSMGGGTITNNGTIEGMGSMGNNVVNTGTIEAKNDTLTLSGTVTNNAGGLLTAATGGKLLMSSGMSANNGIINLNGGTFDNNGHALTNNAQISGHGIFRTGGLTNDDTVTLTGGSSTINGTVTNNGTVTAAYNPVIFTDDFVNNGTFKNTETTVTFAGTYQENGVFISDPAITYIQDMIVGETGALIGGEVNGEYDKWYISNDFINNSRMYALWDTLDAFLGFTGEYDGLQDVYLAGVDLGADLGGFTNNFAWGYVDIASLSTLSLFDGNTDNDGTALYTEILTGIQLDQGLVSNITGDMNIYYLADLEENAYLDGLSYGFESGGGMLIPISGTPNHTPVPGSILLLTSGLLGLVWTRRRND